MEPRGSRFQVALSRHVPEQAVSQGVAHVRGLERSRYHRVGSRLLGHAEELGTLDHALRSAGLSGARAGVSGARRRGRSAQSRSLADRAPDRARDHGAPRGDCRETRVAADPDGPFGGRRVRPAPPRSRLRGGRRDAQLSADRRGAPHAVVAAQVCVARAQESGESPQGGGAHVRAVALRLHEHLRRAGGARRLRAISRAGVGRHLLGQRARELHPGPTGHRSRLSQRRARPAALHLGGRRSSDATRDPALEREALQVEHDHRGEGVRRPLASDARAEGLGGSRRLCARVGGRARTAPPRDRRGILGSR